jgi:hypothetical protein
LIIPVVMERGVMDTSKWNGSIGLHLSHHLYIDFTDDSKLIRCVREIAKRVQALSGGMVVTDKRYVDDRKPGKYTGAVNEEGHRHGLGITVYDDGSIYDGPYINDIRDGKGASYSFPVRSKTNKLLSYDGEYKAGKQHGKGRLLWKNGDVYEGECRSNSFSGVGKLTTIDGTVYEGEFLACKKNGEGILTDSAGIYKGSFSNDEKNGDGSMKYAAGGKSGFVSYEGGWKENNRSGHGAMSYTNGDKYDGNWENDRPEGNGVLTFQGGNKYSGEFHRGHQHGKGKTCYFSGDIFEGNYKLGKKDGQGYYEFKRNYDPHNTTPVKSYYDGEWRNDMMQGFGQRQYPNGNLYVGNFYCNERHGVGQMYFVDGYHYNGTWDSNKMNGKGVYSIKNYIANPEIRAKEKKSLWRTLCCRTVSVFDVEFSDNELLDAKPHKYKIEGNDVSSQSSPSNNEVDERMPLKAYN